MISNTAIFQEGILREVDQETFLSEVSTNSKAGIVVINSSYLTQGPIMLSICRGLAFYCGQEQCVVDNNYVTGTDDNYYMCSNSVLRPLFTQTIPQFSLYRRSGNVLRFEWNLASGTLTTSDDVSYKLYLIDLEALA